MTVLFSDVRGFTTISETYKDDPQGLTTLMNRFLTPVTNAIIARNGTIDKYIGDAVMAFWNAPLDDPDHETDACHAALDILKRVDALNHEREREASAGGVAFVPIKIGIGINTGRCTVGNMGSDLRFQYTVMGDSVNLASRLEGQTKEYGLSIIIGSRTAAAVSGRFALLEIDCIRVKGKTEPEVIYTVVALRCRDSRRIRDFTGALVGTSRLLPQAGLERRPEDARGMPGRLRAIWRDRPDRHLSRSNSAGRARPPGSGWDGVFMKAIMPSLLAV